MAKLSKRQELVLDNIPWVHYYCEPRECTGWMSSQKKCKNAAHWRFTSLKSRSVWAMNQPNGVYCWSHLMHRGLYGSMDEEERTTRQWRKVGVLCASSKMVVSTYDGREYEQFCARGAHDDPYHNSDVFASTNDDDYTPWRCRHHWTDDV